MRISIYINSFFCRLQKTFFVIPVRVFALKLTKKLNKPALAPLQNRKVWRNRPSHLLDTNENWKQVVELNMLKIRAITNDFALWFDFQVRFSFIKQYPFSVSCHHIPKKMIIQLIFLPMTEYPFPWCPIKNWWHSVIDSTSKFLNDDIL